jgi:hypothetical protein
MANPCVTQIRKVSQISERDAAELLQKLQNRAKTRANRKNLPYEKALREIAGEEVLKERMNYQLQKRNRMLSIMAKRRRKATARGLPTLGEGVRAFLVGVSNVAEGSRLSIDYQSKAIHGKYFGRLVAELEREKLISQFKRSDPEFVLQVYREMGAMEPGRAPGSVTGNDEAFRMAKIIDGITSEMVARNNRAGGYISRIPGYIIRQTHDMLKVRSLGKSGILSSPSKDASYKAWRDFVRPLIDDERTFEGADPEKFLRDVHEGIYTGIHGMARDEADLSRPMGAGSLANKMSQHRILWFKDADSAFAYNQRFGTRQFKEAVLQDIHSRARAIALMEGLGPNPESTFRQIVRELQEEARTGDDAAKQVDSLNDWKIRAAYDQVSGRAHISENPTLSNRVGNLKTVIQMSKMGAVVLTSIADRAFMQSELAFQGISHLDIFMKQLTSFIKRSPDDLRTVRYMGVAMDSLIGNALSRFTAHSAMSGWTHGAQKHFFNLNLLNQWTDASKAAAAELMAAHLGDHAHLPFKELPGELQRLLPQYSIGPDQWTFLRRLADSPNGGEGGKMLLPDQVQFLTDDEIAQLVKLDKRKPTAANIARMRDQLETGLRTYYMDRVDIAVPTPGAGERVYTGLGTQSGTPLGEAVGMLMLFKTFPITIMRKILGRVVHGRGSPTFRHWLMNDHRGKFDLAMLMAMGTALGYVSMSLKEMVAGRTPKPLVQDGELQWNVINDAAIRGGSLGMLGDVMLTQYDNDYRGFLKTLSGPAFGQLDTLFDMKSRAMAGESIKGPAGKLLIDNTPFINLFYLRPVLDYFVLWNLREMLSPGYLQKMDERYRDAGQEYLIEQADPTNR